MGYMINGVREQDYVRGTVELVFIDGYVNCEHCPLMSTDYSKRPYCGKTGEILLSTKNVGYDCPIEFQNKGEK